MRFLFKQWILYIIGTGLLVHAFAQSLDIETRILQHFAIIEDSESTAAQIENSSAAILAMGNPAIFLVQKRFSETHHPRYFYLLEKLKQKEKIEDDATEGNWKEKYFRLRFENAKRLAATDKVEDAQRLAEAILLVEPALVFKGEVQDFIHQCRNLLIHQQVVSGILVSAQTYVYPGVPLTLKLGFRNHQVIPIQLMAGPKNAIVLDIVMQEFSIDGEYREQTFSQMIELAPEITLGSGQSLQYSIKIPNTQTRACYTRWKIVGRVPRCRVQVAGKSVYPQIAFPPVVIHGIPREMEHHLREPAQTCSYALQLDQPEALFFASFFLTQADQQKLIPEWIAHWMEKKSKVARIIPNILRNLTGHSFATPIEWHNWWLAQKQLGENP